VLKPQLLDLAGWMERETLNLAYECVQIMLPPGLRPKTTQELRPLVSQVPEQLSETGAALLRLLITRGSLKRSQVGATMKGTAWPQAITELRRRGLIAIEQQRHLPVMHPKTVRMASLIAPPEAWEEGLDKLKRLELYRSVLTFLQKEKQPIEVTVVCAETGAQISHLQKLHARGLIAFNSEEMIRDPLEDLIFTPVEAPSLLPDQQAVWEQIAPWLDPGSTPPAPALLLGVTGSGKTELYLRATEKVLAQGRQALILVPEISLTPQTVRRFVLRFPGRVGVWHSGMTDGERYDTWRRVRSGELTVLVGARSALFAPFSHLGLIVLDEEEDTSYKQSSWPRPFYHARDVAEELARRTGALVLMGSATPSLEAYARAQAGRYRLLEMPRRILGHRQRVLDWQQHLHLPENRYRPLAESPEACTISLPPVQIVDMRAELKAGNRAIFSSVLQQAVDHALGQHQQIIFFLNRRGTATHVFCRDCGWVAACPKCEIPLTYHAQRESLICHHCGHHARMVTRCPQCGSGRVRAFGLGTERLEEQVAERWPAARLMRWDRGLAPSHAPHPSLLERFCRW
jgi:primosomal protein N' (replication factor Y)